MYNLPSFNWYIAGSERTGASDEYRIEYDDTDALHDDTDGQMEIDGVVVACIEI